MNEHNFIHNRIKLIRNNAKLNQEAFGKKLGITKSSVSLLESGKNNPSDQTIILICEKFRVNRDWLLNGGSHHNMYKPDFQVDELADYCADITEGKDPFIADMLLKYKRLSPKHKQAIWEIYEELTAEKKED